MIVRIGWSPVNTGMGTGELGSVRYAHDMRIE